MFGLVGYYGGSGGHCGSDGSGGCPYSSNNTSITIINYYIIELSHLKSFLSLFI